MPEKSTMKSALVVVDVQNDFCEGGSLAVAGGAHVAEQISHYLQQRGEDYDLIVATRDWHIDPGAHFSDAPDYTDTWPPHCVADTEGAEFHPNLDAAGRFLDRLDAIVSKGQYDAAYSGFEGVDGEGRSLQDLLAADGIERVDVVGLATDYCDRATALEALDLGYDVRLLKSLCAGVAAETTAVAIDEMRALGVVVVTV